MSIEGTKTAPLDGETSKDNFSLTGKIYDPQLGDYYQEVQVSQKELAFLYHTRFGRMLLNLFISRPWFSRLMAWREDRPASARKIPAFIQEHNILMEECETENYPSFRAFFRRKLRSDCRPICLEENAVIAPADSKLLFLPITPGLTFALKGRQYDLKSLLADECLPEQFHSGWCLIFRLTVDDCHHYHYPLNGSLLYRKDIPGRLHTVGPMGQGKAAALKENHRLLNLWESETFGQVIQVAVGALLVGRIVQSAQKVFIKGEHQGYFDYGGSTLLYCFPSTFKPRADWLSYSERGVEIKVRRGEKVGGKDAFPVTE